MRRRIMQGAMVELSERGVKFTMDELARRLGVSKRTLYENFASKEEIIGAILAESAAEIKAHREAVAIDDGLCISEKFRQMLAVRSSLWTGISETVFMDIKRCMPDQWRTIENTLDELWLVVETLLQEGVRAGHFRPVFFPAVRIMFRGAYYEFANYQFLAQHKVTIAEMIDHIIDILLYGIVQQAGNEQTGGNRDA